MVYLDYSATTKIDKEVLDTYIKVNDKYYSNPNSLHKLGIEAKELIDASTRQIKDILNLKDVEVIYTSGATESNNLALIGSALRNKKKGMHILTTKLEHSSIYGPLDYLSNNGFEIEYLDTINGLVDLNDLKNKLRDDTILVSIASVNSEVGIKQDIEGISKIIKEYPNCIFHVDATQSIGKVNIDFKDVDLISFTAHKIYGPKGIGCLIKKENIFIEPLILGGKSTTNYRSGTPSTPLIVSLAKALRLITSNIEDDYKKVSILNKKICESIVKYPNIRINSNDNSIPHILNISVVNAKPESILHTFEEYDIYISTKSACSKKNDISEAVLDITKDRLSAMHSVRISLSKYTTEEEVNSFLKAFDEIINKFNSLNNVK